MMRAEKAPGLLGQYRALANHNYYFRGYVFLVAKQDINLKLLSSLRINPRFFRSGGTILFLEKSSYKLMARLCNFNNETEGMYPLAKNGEVEAVHSGKLNKLPKSSRVICLPMNHNRRALLHEILHDIFIGGGLNKEARDAFAKGIFEWAYIALNSPSRKAAADFYKIVADSCAFKFDIQNIGRVISKLSRGDKLNHQEMVFAGECFVYAAEYYFRHSDEKDVSTLPFEILRFFEKIKLMA